MGDLHKINDTTTIKQRTEADTIGRGRPTSNDQVGSVTPFDPVIPLNFAVAQSTEVLKNFIITLGGKEIYSGVDYNFTSILPNNTSDEITLTQTPSTALSFRARLFGVEQAFLPNALTLQSDINDINTELVDTGQYVRAKFEDLICLDEVAPFTEIINRAKIPDLENDLMIRFGPERIMTRDLFEIPDEFGPDNEIVFGILNDKFNQIRLVGDWSNRNQSQGVFLLSALLDDFIEITFYGTGLVILLNENGTARDIRASVDGGGEGNNIQIGAATSGAIDGRNYSPNQKAIAVSGLSLDIYTVKIRNNSANGFHLHGFEILNERTDLLINPGNSFIDTKLVQKLTDENIPFDSDFESGVLGTRGGNVLVYKKIDGTIKKAVTPTNSSAAFLGSADHTNETQIRKGGYYFREFGVGRTDDFSTLQSGTTNRAFTLADNLHNLVGNDVLIASSNEAISFAATADFLSFTFYGTGLDIFGLQADAGNDYELFIDGVSEGTIPATNIGEFSIHKIASGLSLGTHTCKIIRNASPNNFSIRKFITYGPSLPSLPTAAMKLGSYFVNANFLHKNNIIATIGSAVVSEGVVGNSAIREAIYIGTWSGGVDLNVNVYDRGQAASSTTSGDSFEFEFFGSGIVLKAHSSSNRSADHTIEIDGLAFNTANFGSIATDAEANYIGHPDTSFTASTGVLDLRHGAATDGSASLPIVGLALTRHKIIVTMNTADIMTFTAFDVITPIHSPQDDGPAGIQNESPLGSTTLLDLRNFDALGDDVDTPNYAQAVAITSNPTTTSTSFIPLLDMFVVIKSDGAPIEVDFVTGYASSVNTPRHTFAIFVDGVEVYSIAPNQDVTGNTDIAVMPGIIIPVSKGVHTVQIFVKTTNGTLTIESNRRFSVKELK